MAIADIWLVVLSFVHSIPVPYFLVPVPGLPVINNYFIAFIQVIMAIPWRQGGTCYPAVAFIVCVGSVADVVVNIDIRQVIIFSMIVTRRPPFGLDAPVDIYCCLRICCVIHDTGNNQDKHYR